MGNGRASLHAHHGTTGVAEHLDDLARVLVGALDYSLLNGLHLVAALVVLEEHARAAHLELVPLAAHGLHENGQVQDAATGDLNAALVLKLLNAHGHVVLALALEALLELASAHDVAIATHERRG